MKKITRKIIYAKHQGIYLFLVALVLFSAACTKFLPSPPLAGFDQVNLVANKPGYFPAHLDASLQNAWGLAFSTTGTPWVNSTGGHVSEVYDKDGAPIAARPAVNVPSPTAATGGLPTGVVFNGSATEFKLANGNPARFIFVGVDGVLSGWNTGNNAQRIKNNAATSAYTGLALAEFAGSHYIYAADFRAGKVTTWDKNFDLVNMQFKDVAIPAGFSPYNVQAIKNLLYVTYAKVGPDGHDLAGVGNGYVDIYYTDGTLYRRFAAEASLNSPWGVTLAPASFFDEPSKDSTYEAHGIKGLGTNVNEDIVLVGNFGDGHIIAFHQNGNYMGVLKSGGKPITIYGLWALSFPPVTATTVDPRRLYFTAGPNLENDGIFGYLLKK